MRIYKVRYDMKAWTDPWGFGQPAYVIEDMADIEPTLRKHPYNNGYTDELATIYDDGDGAEWFAYAPIDYCGSTTYVNLPSPAYPETRHWERYNPVRRYVLDGQPYVEKPDTWVVYDMTQRPGLAGDEPGWGPMNEAEARRMVARNPRAYWAQNTRTRYGLRPEPA